MGTFMFPPVADYGVYPIVCYDPYSYPTLVVFLIT